MVEQLTRISVRSYMGFGKTTKAALKYEKLYGPHRIGEHNSNNNLHGRGIFIWSNGNIQIGYFHNDRDAPGNFIYINSSGNVDVGEIYMKAGNNRKKYTSYRTDGTTEKFDWQRYLINYSKYS